MIFWQKVNRLLNLDTFEEVKFFQNEELCLKAVLVIHNSGKAGISIGGCRVRKYSDENVALLEAKKLARNMTLKYNAVGMDFGGLKLVIYEIDNSRRKESFEQIGEWIESYKGKCYLATDSGSSLEDMIDVRERTSFVLDLPPYLGGIGSFTPMVVSGVINGLKAGIELKYNKQNFHGLTAYVLGLGITGIEIAHLLLQAECDVYGFDINNEKNRKAENLGVKIRENFLEREYNLFVPCGLDYVLNQSNSMKLQTDIIGGSANNPLQQSEEEALYQRGIIVIPDFIISAGAILLDDVLIAGEKTTLDEGMKRTKKIYELTKRVITQSKMSGVSPYEVALSIIRD